MLTSGSRYFLFCFVNNVVLLSTRIIFWSCHSWPLGRELIYLPNRLEENKVETQIFAKNKTSFEWKRQQRSTSMWNQWLASRAKRFLPSIYGGFGSWRNYCWKKKLLLIFRLVLFVLVECVAMFKCKEMAVLPNKQNRKNFAATRKRKEQNQKII